MAISMLLLCMVVLRLMTKSENWEMVLMLLLPRQADLWTLSKGGLSTLLNLKPHVSTRLIKCWKKGSSLTSRKFSELLKTKRNKKLKTSCSQPQSQNGLTRSAASIWTKPRRKSTWFQSHKLKLQWQSNIWPSNAQQETESTAFKASLKLTTPTNNWVPSSSPKLNCKSPTLPWSLAKMQHSCKAIWIKKKESSIWMPSETEREKFLLQLMLPQEDSISITLDWLFNFNRQETQSLSFTEQAVLVEPVRKVFVSPCSTRRKTSKTWSESSMRPRSHSSTSHAQDSKNPKKSGKRDFTNFHTL